MAKVIIGGQSLSLVLALIVTPVFYVLLDQWVNLTRTVGRRLTRGRRPAPAAPAPAKVEAREPAEVLS